MTLNKSAHYPAQTKNAAARGRLHNFAMTYRPICNSGSLPKCNPVDQLFVWSIILLIPKFCGNPPITFKVSLVKKQTGEALPPSMFGGDNCKTVANIFL